MALLPITAYQSYVGFMHIIVLTLCTRSECVMVAASMSMFEWRFFYMLFVLTYKKNCAMLHQVPMLDTLRPNSYGKMICKI